MISVTGQTESLPQASERTHTPTHFSSHFFIGFYYTLKKCSSVWIVCSLLVHWDHYDSKQKCSAATIFINSSWMYLNEVCVCAFVSSCHKFPVKLLKFRTPVQENSDVKCGFLLNCRLFSEQNACKYSHHSIEWSRVQRIWCGNWSGFQRMSCNLHALAHTPFDAIHRPLFIYLKRWWSISMNFHLLFLSLFFFWLTWREIDKLKRVYASHQTNGPFKMKFKIHFGPVVCSANTALNTMCNDIKWNESVCNLFVIDVSRFVCTQHTIECELIQKWQTFQFPFICTRQMFDGSTSQSSSSSSANKHFCGKKTHSSKW